MNPCSEIALPGKASDYLMAGDPNVPATWLFRIRNDAGELDWKLIDEAKAKLGEGVKQGIFEGDFALWAFQKLRWLYDKPDKESI